jgi:hypothetical protein
MPGKTHRVKTMIIRQDKYDIARRLPIHIRHGAISRTKTLRQKTKRSDNGRQNSQMPGQAYN